MASPRPSQHADVMSRSPRSQILGNILLLSLLPTAAFIIATVVAVQFSTYKHIAVSGTVPQLIISLMFVSGPSLVPVSITKPGIGRWCATAIMTVVAAIAGVFVITTDDAQAGLAVLWVLFTALPLAAAIGIGQAIAAPKKSRPL
jgi:peptidoglycan/LPS O-acetylase OafA/YrhL